jgi:hypothetical protein
MTINHTDLTAFAYQEEIIMLSNNKEISSTGSVGRTQTTTCPETKSDFKLM